MMSIFSHSMPAESKPSHKMASAHLEELAWGLFLLLTGILWLLPEGQVPAGAWLLGTGLILIGLNAVRYFTGEAVGPFSLLLGVLAFAGGLTEMMGLGLPLLALCLVVVGASIVVRVLLGRHAPQVSRHST